jgi:ubiquinone/menaquinone biosynthesis C-methylase UbiE
MALPHDAPPPEVLAYYDAFPEESRLTLGAFRLEFERTREIVARVVPRPPARVIDVGAAAGAYSFWLAGLGYDVHLIDASPRLVEEARRRNTTAVTKLGSLAIADARRLPEESDSAAAVLVMGPLYHLTEPEERARVLREAFRVLSSGGVIVAAAISRYASALDGLAEKLTADPLFVKIRDRDLVDGQHRNDTGQIAYFTTGYFHRPEDLQHELLDAGFHDVRVLGVEGPGWLFQDFDARWGDAALRKDLLDVARALEAEPSTVGVSAHLLGVGRKP